MARGTKEEMQDRLLSGFDKVNRRNNTVVDRSEMLSKLSGSALRKAYTFKEYIDDLNHIIATKEKKMPRHVSEEILNRKNIEQMKKFHSEGAEYSTAYNWIKEQR